MNWDSALYDRQHSFVYKYGEELIALLAPLPGERILDLGSGTGHLTRLIADSGARVTGIDRSTEMIEAARAAHPELEFLEADAADFSFSEPFDAIFSNAVLHWVRRAEEAVISIARALRPGGRLVAEFGGRGNVARLAAALERAVRDAAGIEAQAVNYYPSIGEYAPLLERHGLEVRLAMLFDRMTELEGGARGLRDWYRMFRRDLFERIPAELHESIFARAEDELRDELYRDGRWHADYRRLRLVAVKEAS